MSTSSPVRSHSLIHHKQHTQWIQSQQQLLKQPNTPQRSTSVNHSARLVRSSSLSHHSKKVNINPPMLIYFIYLSQLDTHTF